MPGQRGRFGWSESVPPAGFEPAPPPPEGNALAENSTAPTSPNAVDEPGRRDALGTHSVQPAPGVEAPVGAANGTAPPRCTRGEGLGGAARAPQRIQRRRTAGWRLPEGAVVVTRPTRWGNPWKVGSTSWTVDPDGRINREPHEPLTVAQAVEVFRNAYSWEPSGWPDIIRRELAGKDLACWCPLPAPGQPDMCHGAVLLSIAAGGAA